MKTKIVCEIRDNLVANVHRYCVESAPRVRFRRKTKRSRVPPTKYTLPRSLRFRSPSIRFWFPQPGTACSPITTNDDLDLVTVNLFKTYSKSHYSKTGSILYGLPPAAPPPPGSSHRSFNTYRIFLDYLELYNIIVATRTTHEYLIRIYDLVQSYVRDRLADHKYVFRASSN